MGENMCGVDRVLLLLLLLLLLLRLLQDNP